MKQWKKLDSFEKSMIIALVIALIIMICTSYAKGADKKYIEIVNPPGKYLWHYWEEYGQGQRWDKWLYETMELNGLDTAGIYEGQILRVEVRD